MAFETVIYEKIDKVARVTMNRPEVRNAENQQMNREMFEAFAMAEADDDIRVIILAGAGKSFSAGHDLGSPAAIAEREAGPKYEGGSFEHYLAEEDRWVWKMLGLRDMAKPLIAQVQGYCIMGGCMVATMCDLIVASEDAKFAERAVRAGGASTEYFTYVWELGYRKAKEYLMTGDFFDAQEAYRLGMVNKVVPLEKLEEETLDLANRIAMQSALSLKFIKQAVNYIQDNQGFREGIRYFFNLHMLTHAQRTLMGPGAGYEGLRGDGGSVKDLLKARDEKFGDRG